jgi:hypothetical protein
MGHLRAGSVLALSLVLGSCAAPVIVADPGPGVGGITVRPGRAGVVVAAPHGSSDTHTADLAAEIARRTGFGLVIATGFALEADTRERPGRRYQVNRPLEGVPGRPPAEEVESDGARRVYEAYEARVREAARGPLGFYAEIHGNNRRESADRIEIATVGLERDDAVRLRTLLELIRDAHLRARPTAPRLDVLVEPADALRYTASGAKRSGILRLPERALHIELPRPARTAWRDVYALILAEFLAETVALTVPR